MLIAHWGFISAFLIAPTQPEVGIEGMRSAMSIKRSMSLATSRKKTVDSDQTDVQRLKRKAGLRRMAMFAAVVMILWYGVLGPWFLMQSINEEWTDLSRVFVILCLPTIMAAIL